MDSVLDKQSLKALGADTRQQIIKLLSDRPYTASELSKLLGKHVTTISEHLSTLERSELIEKKEDGHKWIYYKLSQKGERLTKPMFNSWKIMLVLSALAFAGSIYDFTKTSADETAKYGAPQLTAQNVYAVSPALQTWIILIAAAIILLIIAIILRKRNK